jgi:hypothetical protein
MASKGILSSWKEIAAYLGRSERTIQRWEIQFGFPIHRPSGRKGASIIAMTAEIDEWIRNSPSGNSRGKARNKKKPAPRSRK